MSPALAGVDGPAAAGHMDSPAVAGRADVTARQQAANDAAAAQPFALIVDDSPFLALHLARQLEGLGFQALVPTDAADLRARAGQAALICVELELFQACGFDVTRELAERSACPLVLLTGTGRKTDLQWGLRAGASAVLQRPIREAALRAALMRIGCGNVTQ